jgi:hypothetical protein
MSFKNHNNYWYKSIQSEPEFFVETKPMLLSVSVSVADTYITDEHPNFSNIQIFNSGTQDFQILPEVSDADSLLDLPVDDARQSYIQKITLAKGVPSDGGDLVIGTIDPSIIIPADCRAAQDRGNDKIKKAQEELADCLSNSKNPEDDPYKKFLECRQKCKDQMNDDLADWLTKCKEVGTGDEIPMIPERNCINGQAVWNWHSAVSQECKESFCKIVSKYVDCIGGASICESDPCTGIPLDRFGGDGNDNGIPPTIYGVASECAQNNPDYNPTKPRKPFSGGGIWGPDDEIAGSPCWTAYYRKLFAAQCEADIICKVKDAYDNYCCNSFMFDTTDYCRSLGCVSSRDYTDGYPIWSGCGPENKILCLQRKLENIQKKQACVRQSPDGQSWNGWNAHKAARACEELAKAKWERDYSNATTDEEREQAGTNYEANIAQCLSQFQYDYNLGLAANG